MLSIARKPIRFNIPMILTWSRIVAIPFVIGIFYVPDDWLVPYWKNFWAAILFILAAITDAFDGYLARRLNMESAIGAFLDQSADKLMVCASMIVLCAFHRVDLLIALIIIGREITVTALREWMAKIGAASKVKVNRFGKFKTIVQMVAIPMLLFYDTLFGIDMAELGTVLIWVAAALTLYSMYVYISIAGPYLNTDSKSKLIKRPKKTVK